MILLDKWHNLLMLVACIMIPLWSQGQIKMPEKEKKFAPTQQKISGAAVDVIWQGETTVLLIIGGREIPMTSNQHRSEMLITGEVLQLSVKTPAKTYRADDFLLIQPEGGTLRIDLEDTPYGYSKNVVFAYEPPSQKQVQEKQETQVKGNDNNVQKKRESQNKVFSIAEEMPSFPGGDSELLRYLATNMKYPEKAKEAGIMGIVYTSFVVDDGGAITNIEVLRGVGGGCDKEAIRLLENMPKWHPGIQGGKPVSVKYNLPIRFDRTNME